MKTALALFAWGLFSLPTPSPSATDVWSPLAATVEDLGLAESAEAELLAAVEALEAAEENADPEAIVAEYENFIAVVVDLLANSDISLQDADTVLAAMESASSSAIVQIQFNSGTNQRIGVFEKCVLNVCGGWGVYCVSAAWSYTILGGTINGQICYSV